jgi:hypothetical protein
LHNIERLKCEVRLTLGAEEDTALGTALKSLVELSGEGSLADVGNAGVVGQKVLLDGLTAIEKYSQYVCSNKLQAKAHRLPPNVATMAMTMK